VSAAVAAAAGAARRLGVPVRNPAVAGDARARLRARVAWLRSQLG
jgi:hypothetical protein